MDSIYRTRSAEKRVSTWCTQRILEDPATPRCEQWDLHHGRTHLLSIGETSPGPTIVVLPGTNTCAAAILPFLHALSGLGPVLVPDVPGQPGLSTRRRVRDEPVSYLGAWLDELLDQLDRPVIVVGHSLGAAITLQATSSNIQRRVLLNPAGIVDLALPYRAAAAAVKWFVSPNTRTSRTMLQVLNGPEREPARTTVDWFALVGRATWTSLAPAPLPAADLARASEHTPVHVATGRHDPFLPPERLAGPTRDRLGVDTTVLDTGHLLDHRSASYVRESLGDRTPGPAA